MTVSDQSKDNRNPVRARHRDRISSVRTAVSGSREKCLRNLRKLSVLFSRRGERDGRGERTVRRVKEIVPRPPETILPENSFQWLYARRSPLAARRDQRGLNYTPFNHSDKYSLSGTSSADSRGGRLSSRRDSISLTDSCRARYISPDMYMRFIYRTYDARPGLLPEARILDLFFRGGGFALLRFYGIAHRRESERAGPVDPRYFAYQ